MTKVGKRYFTPEFKREAVALWETSGRTQTEVAGELGIMPTMLRRWQRGIGVGAVKLTAQPPTSIMASPADQASEIAKLRSELDRTRMERDILKKPWWVQPVIATASANVAPGVRKPRVFRGRVLSLRAITSRSVWV
jgi:transposase